MKLKQMMKKTAVLTCIAACSVFLLTGCSSTSAKTEPAEKQGAAQTENTDTQKGGGAPVEITFTVWDYGTTDYWKVLVEAFEKENPDIKVKVTDIGGTDYDTKIPFFFLPAIPLMS